mmetsp:Transcript_5062/g.18914  ORF Transcript_5062/g.18914 Transcript_5062/m.18914 type:complete len:220 (+) Transcript_5062:267-926(+)
MWHPKQARNARADSGTRAPLLHPLHRPQLGASGRRCHSHAVCHRCEQSLGDPRLYLDLPIAEHSCCFKVDDVGHKYLRLGLVSVADDWEICSYDTGALVADVGWVLGGYHFFFRHPHCIYGIYVPHAFVGRMVVYHLGHYDSGVVHGKISRKVAGAGTSNRWSPRCDHHVWGEYRWSGGRVPGEGYSLGGLDPLSLFGPWRLVILRCRGQHSRPRALPS